MNYRRFLGAASAALMIVIVITLVLAPGAWAQSKYKTLYKFKGGKDGSGAFGRPDLRRSRKSLRNDGVGGAHKAGTVFKLTPTSDGGWTESVLYSFTGGRDGAAIPSDEPDFRFGPATCTALTLRGGAYRNGEQSLS